jgi:energy-coupling factor transport system permease protein
VDAFGFRSLHPAVLFIYYAGGMTFGMLLFHPVVLLGGLAANAAVHAALDGGRELRKWLKFLLPGILVLAAVNPVLVRQGATVWFYAGNFSVTKEAVVYGLTLAAAVLNLMLLAVSYRVVFSGEKFLHLFGRWAPNAALAAMMAIGLVPRMRRRLAELALVQQMRGVTVASGPLRARAASGLKLVWSLAGWSLEDALRTADSMRARGYGTGPRSSYRHYRFRFRDGVSGVFFLAAAAAMLACWANGFGFLRVYPRLPELAPGAGDWIALAVYAGFMAFPLLWEWRDRAAWPIWK